jgi:hypothetical protein
MAWIEVSIEDGYPRNQTREPSQVQHKTRIRNCGGFVGASPFSGLNEPENLAKSGQKSAENGGFELSSAHERAGSRNRVLPHEIKDFGGSTGGQLPLDTRIYVVGRT